MNESLILGLPWKANRQNEEKVKTIWVDG